jgi:molybdenum cofactor cytidylyltransferase
MTSERIAAIVLAAGKSQRMVRLKPLLPFGDKPMLVRVLENLQAALGIDPLIVVTGHAVSDIMSAVQQHLSPPHSIAFAHNVEHETGEMLSSVQAGVRALPSGTKAFFLALGDQPGVLPSTLNALREAWQSTQAPIVLPTYNGRRGHPLLFTIACVDEILSLPPEATLRDVVQRHRSATVEVPVDDSAVIADVDTPDDYERALRQWSSSRGGF